jgi:DNA-binding transcriptional LysR family regulator
VAFPSRRSPAIQTLEAELGGELFKRERALTHLTDLGVKMAPLVQQCFDSAVAANSLANSLKSGAVTPLKLARSSSINIAFLLPQLIELSGNFAKRSHSPVSGPATPRSALPLPPFLLPDGNTGTNARD